MKFKYLFISLALICFFSACNRDEASLFEKSAAERAQYAIENAKKILIDQTAGWEMLYFANTESRGYNLIVSFSANGKVVATAKNSLTTNNKILTDSSTWLVKSDYGPILSFDTYNKVLHAWSDPQDDGDGLLGDYEFLIISATPERIVLKGKKHSAYSILRPMPNLSVEEYYNQVNSALNKYFAGGNIMTYQSGDISYYLHNGGSGIFTVTEVGSPAPDTDPVLYPICPTIDGFMMSFGLNEDRTERLYTLSTNKFVGEEGATISSGDLSLLFITFISNNKGWAASVNNSTGDFANAAKGFVNQINSLSNVTGGKINSVGITYSDSLYHYAGSYVLRIKFEYKASGKKQSLTADYAINVKRENNTIVMTYKEPANGTGKTWYERAETSELANLVNATMGTFTLSAVDPINATKEMIMKNSGSELHVSTSSNLK